MKILIFESVCGGSFEDADPPPDLLRQGREMLRAALEDFSRLPKVQVYTLVESRFSFAMPDGVECRHPQHDWQNDLRTLVQDCDAALIIAPESEHQLESLCEEVEQSETTSLNCSVEAIRLCADKWMLSLLLKAAGVPVVTTDLCDPARWLPEDGVLKPRYGAGGEDTFALWENPDLQDIDLECEWAWQPWLPGQSVSVSLLVEKSGAEVLSCNKIPCKIEDGQVRMQDAETGGMEEEAGLRQAAESLACELLEKIPGLCGYVGVDGIWEDGAFTVLEINPRLTLTYAGQPAPLAGRMLRAFGLKA